MSARLRRWILARARTRPDRHSGPTSHALMHIKNAAVQTVQPRHIGRRAGAALETDRWTSTPLATHWRAGRVWAEGGGAYSSLLK